VKRTTASNTTKEQEDQLNQFFGGMNKSSEYDGMQEAAVEDWYVAKFMSLFGYSIKRQKELAFTYCGGPKLTVDWFNSVPGMPFRMGVVVPKARETMGTLFKAITSPTRFVKSLVWKTWDDVSSAHPDEPCIVLVRYRDFGKRLVFTNWGREELEENEFRMLVNRDGCVYMLQPLDQWLSSVGASLVCNANF